MACAVMTTEITPNNIANPPKSAIAKIDAMTAGTNIEASVKPFQKTPMMNPAIALSRPTTSQPKLR